MLSDCDLRQTIFLLSAALWIWTNVYFFAYRQEVKKLALLISILVPSVIWCVTKLNSEYKSLCIWKENHDFPERWLILGFSVLGSITSHSAFAKTSLPSHYSQSRLQSQVGHSSDELIFLDLKSKKHNALKSSLCFIYMCHLIFKKYCNFFYERTSDNWVLFPYAIPHQWNFKEWLLKYLSSFFKSNGHNVIIGTA